MRPGAIVVVTKCEPHPSMMKHVIWLPVADSKTPYMLREVLSEDKMENGVVAVYFEEGIIGLAYGTEIAFPIEWVKEILPPEDISEVIEECMMQTI
jgi:hypothetical protein